MKDYADFGVEGLRLASEAGVLTITLDRAAQGNAVSPEMGAALTTVFQTAQTDAGVRCIVLRGEGPNLSAGGDVAGFSRLLPLSAQERSDQFRQRLQKAGDMVRAVLSFDRPLITVHRGAAAGVGLLYSLAADVVIADETALFLFSHQKIGLPPDGGVSFLLPRIVGWRAARRLVLSAARVEATEAVSLGLLETLHPAADLDTEAQAQAKRLARAPQFAMQSAKRLLNADLMADLDARLDAETEAMAVAVALPDFDEGVTAFLGKRRADYPSAR